MTIMFSQKIKTCILIIFTLSSDCINIKVLKESWNVNLLVIFTAITLSYFLDTGNCWLLKVGEG